MFYKSNHNLKSLNCTKRLIHKHITRALKYLTRNPSDIHDKFHFWIFMGANQAEFHSSFHFALLWKKSESIFSRISRTHLSLGTGMETGTYWILWGSTGQFYCHRGGVVKGNLLLHLISNACEDHPVLENEMSENGSLQFSWPNQICDARLRSLKSEVGLLEQ